MLSQEERRNPGRKGKENQENHLCPSLVCRRFSMLSEGPPQDIEDANLPLMKRDDLHVAVVSEEGEALEVIDGMAIRIPTVIQPDECVDTVMVKSEQVAKIKCCGGGDSFDSAFWNATLMGLLPKGSSLVQSKDDVQIKERKDDVLNCNVLKLEVREELNDYEIENYGGHHDSTSKRKFRKAMKNKDEGFRAGSMIYLATLKACANYSAKAKEEIKELGEKSVKFGCLKEGLFIHSQIAKGGHEVDIIVANNLVDMYASAGSFELACCVFDRILRHNLVSWNGECESGLWLVAYLQGEGWTPKGQAFITALKACKNLMVLRAENVLNLMSSSSLIAWNFLAGYTHQKDFELVFELFNRMQEECFQAESCLLNTCSRSCLKDKGNHYFEVMHLLVAPGIAHCACMVDYFSRANLQDDAVAAVNVMPYKPDLSVWRTVVGACQKCNNVVRLVFAAIRNLELGNKDLVVPWRLNCEIKRKISVVMKLNILWNKKGSSLIDHRSKHCIVSLLQGGALRRWSKYICTAVVWLYDVLWGIGRCYEVLMLESSCRIGE